jgi:hypothetical protein
MKTYDKIDFAVCHMCGIILFYKGWRLYMEDTAIS